MTDTPMPDEGFLRRWARLKAQPTHAPAQPTHAPAQPTHAPAKPVPAPTAHPAPAAPPADAPERPTPTLADVARLTPQSDYAAFVTRDVDPAVRRLALKKLFADPDFAVMDGLDIYISDYTTASPLTDAMLASLKHAPGVLERLFGKSDEPDQAAADNKDAVIAAVPSAPDLPGPQHQSRPQPEPEPEPEPEPAVPPSSQGNA